MEITEDNILFFDMDGTLVDTDLANFSSYRKAILSVLKLDREIHYNPSERFNRTTLKTILSTLTEVEYQKIIQRKEDNYNKYLHQTKLNRAVADILTRYSKTNKTVLVTNCREDRAMETLNYHSLTDKFSNLIFRKSSGNKNRINKYKNAISYLSLSSKTVIAFENEKQEVEDALSAGIEIENIFSI